MRKILKSSVFVTIASILFSLTGITNSVAAPLVTATTMYTGQSLTVSGSGFNDAASLYLQGYKMMTFSQQISISSFTINSDSSLTFTVPASSAFLPGAADAYWTIQVRDAGGGWANTGASSLVIYTLPAPAFSLSSVSETATVGTAITGYSINSTGGTIASYSISPAISNTPGLSFSTSTGLITGTPTTAAAARTYTITATNATSPAATRTFAITVNPMAYSSGTGAVYCGTGGYFTVTSYVVTSHSSCAGTATIPSGVTSVGNDAFYNATALTGVTIPSSVNFIGTSSFRHTGLVTLVIPNSVISIGEIAFYDNPSITSLTISTGITAIPANAFRSLTALTSLIIPSGVTSIGQDSFAYSSSLTSLTLPGSLISIASGAFWGATSLTSLTIPSGVTSIGVSAFSGASSLNSLTLPSNLTSIPGYAFYGATSLTSLTIPDSVTSIGASAFSSTSALNSYTYCGTVTSAGLTTAGLGGKTKASCALPVVYVAPTPVPYLKTLTTPKMNLKDGKLVCTPGTYNAGYTLDGVNQGSATVLFTPSSYTYNLLINGVAQTLLSVTTPLTSTSWNLSAATSGSLVACSVTVSANSLTNTDKSSDNTPATISALATQATSIATANTDYSASQSANSKAYQKALVDNRATWRKQIDAIRTNYYDTLNRIKANGGSKMVADTSTALKIMIAAQKKSAADYAASKPAALAAKDLANKAALTARDAAISKANATYGTFIESIGYGVLI